MPSGNILAVTFTNKAAEEMKHRLQGLIGQLSNAVWMGTFHSICLNILRNEAEYIGLAKSFSVIDQEDRLSLIRQILKSLNIDTTQFKPKAYLHAISSYKNTENYARNDEIEENYHMLKTVFQAYQKELELQRLVDFDDMISLCVRLFNTHPNVLEKYKELYKYILVDEYQDTNAVQFRLLYMLAGEDGNLCVVGDDDQSIYGWRGAEVRNILEFDKVFKNVQEIKLEGNYRSGKSILSIANRLIENNTYRRGKTLEASSDKEADVRKFEFTNEYEEAEFAAGTILKKIEDDGVNPADIAILYRTNAQSLNFERALKMKNIPHKVVGNIGFYQRREVKDILSYLKFSSNKRDTQSFIRSITTPKRGIGNSSIDKILSYAEDNDIDIMQALNADLKFLAKHRATIERYIAIINKTEEIHSIPEKIKYIIDALNYKEYLKGLGEEADVIDRKMENLDELVSDAVRFEESSGSSLQDFLASAALVTSSDEDAEHSVKLMTMHAAKGLEFKIVFLTGLEEGLFPLGNSEGETNIEEERRLCYVGITRAMETLYITRARNRLRRDRHNHADASRFLGELQYGAAFKFNKGKTQNTFTNINGKYADYIKSTTNSQKKEYNNSSAVFAPSAKVRHSVFGEGVVLFSEGSGNEEKVTVHFKKAGIKKIIAEFLEPA